MKLCSALIVLLALSACQKENSDLRDAREYSVKRTKEVLCKEGGKAEALHEIAATASAAPSAEIDEVVYEVARRIEREGCANVIKKNAKRWRVEGS